MSRKKINLFEGRINSFKHPRNRRHRQPATAKENRQIRSRARRQQFFLVGEHVFTVPSFYEIICPSFACI